MFVRLVVGGEVGEGMFGDGYFGEMELFMLFIVVRWDDDMIVLFVVFEGLRVCLIREGLCVVWRWVGDVVFGVVLSLIILVEYFFDRLLLYWLVDDGVGVGGDRVFLYDGLCGKGCW